MKPKLYALALLAVTAGLIVVYPLLGREAAPVKPVVPAHKPVILPAETSNQRPKVDIAFVLDTTGSMGGLIATAKEKIWSIASTMAAAKPAPEIRMALVAYRDRGDAYITQVHDLSPDLDTLYGSLMDFRADGGGDGPESVNQALHDGVHKLSWSQDQGALKILFLVGDAPPHMDYQDDVKWPETLQIASARGIRVNAIQCGQSQDTTRVWTQIAAAGQGQYVQVEQAGGAVAIASPYDKRMAELAAELDATRMYYGDAQEKARKARKMEATSKLEAKASVESRARRAAFNATESGEKSFLGKNELVDDVASGRVALEAIPAAALPEPIQALPAARQKEVIEETASRRAELKGELKGLAEKRDAYLKQQVAAEGGAKDSLDEKVYRAVREQGAAAGLRFEADAPAY